MRLSLSFDEDERPTLGEVFRIFLDAAREDLGREPRFIRFWMQGEDGCRRYHEFTFN